MADFVSPRTRESINGHTILVAPVETTVWLTGGGGKDPDFWSAFEDGEGRVIGDEPGNTRKDQDLSEEALSQG